MPRSRRPHRPGPAVLAALIAGALLLAGAPAAPPAGARSAVRSPAAAPAPAAVDLAPDARVFLGLLNDYRRSLGLPAVTAVAPLTRAASWYAGDLARNDSFSHSHIDTRGRTIAQRFADFGYRGPHPLSEASLEGPRAPAAALDAFRHSPPHDAILRDRRLRAVGVGFALLDGDPARTFWVASFGPQVHPAPARVRSLR